MGTTSLGLLVPLFSYVSERVYVFRGSVPKRGGPFGGNRTGVGPFSPFCRCLRGGGGAWLNTVARSLLLVVVFFDSRIFTLRVVVHLYIYIN